MKKIKEDVKIKDIKINNPEIPKNYYDSKYGVLDLKITLNNEIEKIKIKL